MGLRKKILYSLIATAIFFAAIEISARLYHAVKYRDPSAISYGKKYLQAMIFESRKSAMVHADPYRGPSDEAERAFNERASRTRAPIPVRAPVNTIIWGYPSYFNRYGFRNRDIEPLKQANTTRILIIGGSFVEGVGVSDTDTFPFLTQKLALGGPGNVEVINAGDGGATIHDLLIRLVDTCIKLKPDYVIVFSAYNNHNLINAGRKLSVGWQMSSFFYNVSRFYAMLREKIALKVYKDNNYFLYNYSVAVSRTDVDSLMRLYRKRLDQMNTVCNESGAVLIAGLQPEFIPSGLKSLQNLFDKRQLAALDRELEKEKRLSYYELEFYMQARFNAEMKRFADENGLLSFDAVSIFPEDKYGLFIDQIHPNPTGTSLIAGQLYAFLKRNNIIK